MRKIVDWIIMFVIAFLLAMVPITLLRIGEAEAHSNDYVDEDSRFTKLERVSHDSDYDLYLAKDKETGVEYLIHKGRFGNSNITPLDKADEHQIENKE